MDKTIRILIVEDSEDDYLLLLRALRQGGLVVATSRVVDAAGLRTALLGEPWDVVISDAHLPGFGAEEALSICRELAVEIPFLVVSGVIRERQAVELLRAGAHDFIQKNDFSRLVPALERELQESETRRQKRRAERQLEASRRNLARAQAIAKLGSWDWDTVRDELFWSDEMFRLLGERPGAFSPGIALFLERIPQRDRQRVREALTATRDRQRPGNLEFNIVLPDGNERTLHGLLEAERVSGRPTGHLVATFQDITERIRMRESLERAKRAADAASHAKSEFLAVMSHEIRTPLNAILGMAEVIQATRLDHQQTRFIDVIFRAGKNLLSLIEDIFDLTQIESGRMVLERKPVDLRELTRDAMEIHAQKADEKGLRLICRIDPNAPFRFDGDPKRLRQVLLNLLGNAVKFTNEGSVALHVSRPEAGELLFSISDTGIGIPDAQQGTIFEPFSLVDASMTRKYGGIGLGLSLCKRLVEAMNGHIRVESEPGAGSIFHFSIPLQSTIHPPAVNTGGPTHTPPQPIRKATGPGCSILLAEDVEENAAVIVAFLKNTPHELDIAENGQEAVEKIVSGKRYDLILMDIQMPILDGLEATRRIRAWEKQHGWQRNRIMALSAHAMSGDADKSLAADCDGHLTKPINRSRLLTVINACDREPVPGIDHRLQSENP